MYKINSIEEGLQKAIQTYGKDVLSQERLVYILDDFHGYENPMQKNILRELIKEGLTKSFVRCGLFSKKTYLISDIECISVPFSNRHSFQKEMVSSILYTLLLATGKKVESIRRTTNNSSKLVECNFTNYDPSLVGMSSFLFMVVFLFKYLVYSEETGVFFMFIVEFVFLIMLLAREESPYCDMNTALQKRVVSYENSKKRLKIERVWSVVLLFPLLVSFLLSVLILIGGIVRNDWFDIVFCLLDITLCGLFILIFQRGNYFGKKLICDKLSQTQFVVINTKPDDVYINLGYGDIHVPNGTMMEELPVGEYKAVVTPLSSDYKPATQSFKLEPDNKTTIYVELKESNPSFSVSIETNGHALCIDNGPVVTVKGISYSCKLKKGKHEVKIISYKHKPIQHEIVVNGYDPIQKFSLQAGDLIVGKLKVVSSIQGLGVIVDKRNVGTAPIILNTLPIGQHEIQFHKKGKIVHRNIYIEEGKECLIDVDSVYPQEFQEWNTPRTM